MQKFSFIYLFAEQFLYGNSVSPYCFPLPTVLLYTVFMMMIFIISCSISLYSGKNNDHCTKICYNHMSVILMTTLFYKALILVQGEI